MKRTLLTAAVIWLSLNSVWAYQKDDVQSIVGFWNGHITKDEKSRPVELEFHLKDDQLLCRWSIPETGIIQAPLGFVNFQISTGHMDIGGEFISGKIETNKFTGSLSAHGFTGQVSLEKRNSSILKSARSEKVMFKNGDVLLSGELFMPKGKGPFPSIIFVHGSGPGLASDWNYAARRLADMGFATLTYDKRGSGSSEGNWITSSINDLAEDVLAAIDMLEKHEAVDSERIGLWGHSQGGWIGPLTSSMTDKVAFQVMVSGGGITPRDSEMSSYLKNLTYGDFGAEVGEEVRSLVNDYFEYLSTGNDRELLVNKINNAKSKPWFPYINLDRVMVSDKNRRNWSWVADYDPVVDISQLKEPVLVIYGGEDIIDDGGRSISAWLAGLKKAKNHNYELEVFPKGNHGLRIGNHDSGPFFWQNFVPGYWETAERWLKRNVIDVKD